MRPLTRIGVGMLLASLVAARATAGTISLAWDPVTDPDLAGYRIYFGTSPGNYTQSLDVGTGTAATLSGLSDCTTYYVAVKARDAAGNVSVDYSNVVTGWPRPTLTLAAPASAEQGLPLDVVITGANFQAGATVSFGNPAITVHSVSITSCSQIVASITIGASAATGATTIDVTNPGQVFGTASGLFSVTTAVAPTVASTSPVNGATGVAANVRPMVTFSETMKASTITAATVQLLDAGTPVAQAAGSPTLSPDGRTATIVPAADLALGRTYKIQVVGGASGVRDLANVPMATTFVQATGFATAPDTDAPVISSVSSGSVQSTSARILWTTDEPSDSQVFYRKAAEVSYQQTPLDAALVTSHDVLLQGLAPSTTYHYYVQSADAAGNRSSSSPDGTFTTSANTFTYLAIEAESGVLTAPVRQTTGAGAFRGAWIDTPAGTPTGSATSPAGKAEYGFHVPEAGTWRVWVRLYGASTTSDAWYETVDGAARQLIVPATTGAWRWTVGRSYTLAEGLHTLELGGREAQARADRILVTNDPSFVPTEQPGSDVTPPSAPAGVTATAGDRQVTLGWTNPSSTDLATVVVRYRTDGRVPTSPVDGLPLVSRAATPGASESVSHTGLANGTTHTYSIFAVDASGNASSPAQVQASPADDVPPGSVGNTWRTDTR